MTTLLESAVVNSKPHEISKLRKILIKCNVKQKKKKKIHPDKNVEIEALKLVGNYYTFDVCELARCGII